MRKALTHLPKHKQIASRAGLPAIRLAGRAASDETAFKPLNKAYVRVRYDTGYKITKQQLEYLSERVQILQRLTKKICVAKIESFG